MNDWDVFASAWTTNTAPAFHIEEFGLHCTGPDEIKAKLFDVVSRVHLEPGAKSGRM